MKLIQNKTAIRGPLMMAVMLGTVVLSAGTARAEAISISYITSGTFSTGTPIDLTYTPTSFSGTTSDAGFLLLPDLGQFNLGATADPTKFNGNNFTLHLNFLTPLGVIGAVDFVASLTGHINGNGNGNVHVNFTPNSSVVSFANNVGSGTFTLAVNDVIGLQRGGSATANGNIADAIDPPVGAPEPGSMILLGSGLIAVAYTARRKVRR